MVERTLKIPELAKLSGFSAQFLRSACRRAPFAHPLPFVPIGDSKRPHYGVRMSAFNEWVREEEEMGWK